MRFLSAVILGLAVAGQATNTLASAQGAAFGGANNGVSIPQTQHNTHTLAGERHGAVFGGSDLVKEHAPVTAHASENHHHHNKQHGGHHHGHTKSGSAGGGSAAVSGHANSHSHHEKFTKTASAFGGASATDDEHTTAPQSTQTGKAFGGSVTEKLTRRASAFGGSEGHVSRSASTNSGEALVVVESEKKSGKHTSSQTASAFGGSAFGQPITTRASAFGGSDEHILGKQGEQRLTRPGSAYGGAEFANEEQKGKNQIHASTTVIAGHSGDAHAELNQQVPTVSAESVDLGEHPSEIAGHTQSKSSHHDDEHVADADGSEIAGHTKSKSKHHDDDDFPARKLTQKGSAFGGSDMSSKKTGGVFGGSHGLPPRSVRPGSVGGGSTSKKGSAAGGADVLTQPAKAEGGADMTTGKAGGGSTLTTAGRAEGGAAASQLTNTGKAEGGASALTSAGRAEGGASALTTPGKAEGGAAGLTTAGKAEGGAGLTVAGKAEGGAAGLTTAGKAEGGAEFIDASNVAKALEELKQVSVPEISAPAIPSIDEVKKAVGGSVFGGSDESVTQQGKAFGGSDESVTQQGKAFGGASDEASVTQQGKAFGGSDETTPVDAAAASQCKALTSCEDCAAAMSCGWSVSTGSCLPGGEGLVNFPVSCPAVETAPQEEKVAVAAAAPATEEASPVNKTGLIAFGISAAVLSSIGLVLCAYKKLRQTKQASAAPLGANPSDEAYMKL